MASAILTTYDTDHPVASLNVHDNTIAPLNATRGRASYINPDVTQFTFSNDRHRRLRRLGDHSGKHRSCVQQHDHRHRRQQQAGT